LSGDEGTDELHGSEGDDGLYGGADNDDLEGGAGNRDRKKPRGPSLPHHRTNGSRIRRFDELNSYRGARLGSPKFVKKRNGSANANAGVFDSRHGPCADLLVFHASRTDTPRLRSSR
jgi:hypothetical protein